MTSSDAPFSTGQTVSTSFLTDTKQADIPRSVTRCYASRNCQSGWLVDTIDRKGNVLAGLDSDWFRKVE